ncbi:MAG: DUF3422 family protein [Labrys sp. (in: a-proteobacteria)]
MMGDGARFGGGTGETWEAHDLRRSVLQELHARPFRPILTGRRVIHAAFLTESARFQENRAALADYLARHRGAPLPNDGARHHRTELHRSTFVWESHGEFTTCAWECPLDEQDWFGPLPNDIATLIGDLPQPGPLLVAVDLALAHDRGETSRRRIEALFEGPSMAASDVEGGSAMIATDFAADPRGFVRFVAIDRRMTRLQAGALVKRLLELETYRSLALLGLPEAQRLAPSIRHIETQLAIVTAEVGQATTSASNKKLLDAISTLSAELEAGASASLYRFGASRAYHELVTQRLAILEEQPIGDLTTLSSFLGRRLSPAMRTCQTTEERQANLSRKLTRAANLLRTRIDLDLELQNAEILRTLSDRAAAQLRLQQTVEGLSIAAISYYVVGLVAYVLKGLKDSGTLKTDSSVMIAISVPIVIIGIALIVRRIRRKGEA